MATERGSLGLGQRLLLFVAWFVSCGFVYVLGVYVGKGMRGDGSISPRVALPVEATVPPAPAAEAQAPLTFYDVLGAREGGTPSVPAVPPAGGPPPQRAGLTEQKLPPAAPPPPAAAPAARPGVATEVAKGTPPPPAPAVRPGSATEVAKGAPPPPPAAARPTPASIVPPPPAIPAPGPAPVVAKPAVTAAPAAPASPAPGAAPPAVAALPPQTASGRWTVYANPSRDRLAVEHERAALQAKGYPAEVVTLRRDGDTWYRIRVGRYATEMQAEEASRRLRNDGVGHAFVQSE